MGYHRQCGYAGLNRLSQIMQHTLLFCGASSASDGMYEATWQTNQQLFRCRNSMIQKLLLLKHSNAGDFLIFASYLSEERRVDNA